MGGRSKKKSSGGYNPVKRVTQSDAMGALNGLMGQQVGVVGAVLDELIPRGEAMMGNNPGLHNFMRKAGQKKSDFDKYLQAGPGGILEKMDGILGINRGGDAAVKDNPLGLTDEQIAQAGKYQMNNPTYNYNSPFNINDYMRNQNLNR
jgi:hypothetical protein